MNASLIVITAIICGGVLLCTVAVCLTVLAYKQLNGQQEQHRIRAKVTLNDGEVVHRRGNY